MLINDIIDIIIKKGLDAYIISSKDEFLSEYSAKEFQRLRFVTNFTGSNGVAIITHNKLVFFTDGRYIAQAHQELSSDFEILNLANKSFQNWLIENNFKKIGYDPFCHTLKELSSINQISVPCDNIIDDLWKDRPVVTNSMMYNHELKYSGEANVDKLNKITIKSKADYILLSSPESVCWLLNIRGNDVEYLPVINSYAIINVHTKKINFYSKKITNKQDVKLNIEFFSLDEINLFIQQQSDKIFQLDQSNTPIWFLQNIKNFYHSDDPTLLLRACKNNIEIDNSKQFHLQDALALLEFYHWFELNDNFSELQASQKLLDLRNKSKDFLYPSFNTISAFSSNGAIIHYAPKEDSQKIIKGNGLYLVDSGGQYKGATTDITRVFIKGEASTEQKKNYTLVLKGHLALANAVFPPNVTGANLDILARQFLWNEYKDYPHGTGHGVGNFLNVHEGPHSINLRNQQILKPGMIISNEPGYYIEGEYGIRIENLLYIKSCEKSFLRFENLTLVPYELKLIEKNMLTNIEINQINAYHDIVREKISQKINDKYLLDFLKLKTSPL